MGKKLSQRKYIENSGLICPNCEATGPEDIDAFGAIDADGPIATQSVRCKVCGATWIDHFKLYMYSDLSI